MDGGALRHPQPGSAAPAAGPGHPVARLPARGDGRLLPRGHGAGTGTRGEEPGIPPDLRALVEVPRRHAGLVPGGGTCPSTATSRRWRRGGSGTFPDGPWSRQRFGGSAEGCRGRRRDGSPTRPEALRSTQGGSLDLYPGGGAARAHGRGGRMAAAPASGRREACQGSAALLVTFPLRSGYGPWCCRSPGPGCSR